MSVSGEKTTQSEPSSPETRRNIIMNILYLLSNKEYEKQLISDIRQNGHLVEEVEEVLKDDFIKKIQTYCCKARESDNTLCLVIDIEVLDVLESINQVRMYCHFFILECFFNFF